VNDTNRAIESQAPKVGTEELEAMNPFAPAMLLSAFLSVTIGTLLYGRNPSHAINRILLAASNSILLGIY